MTGFPKHAVIGERQLTFVKTIPHATSCHIIIECIDEEGLTLFTTKNEWNEGACAFNETAQTKGLVTSESSTAEKIRLFRSLFKGRNNMYGSGYRRKDGGIAYAPACANKWKPGICPKRTSSKTRCAECERREFLPLTDRTLIGHFKGRDEHFRDVVGLYVLDENCNTSVLVADFDKQGWQEGVAAYRDAGKFYGIDVAVERSRSGNGGHAWLFFEEPVSAQLARDLGSALVTTALRNTHALRFDAYDRFFPAQNTIPEGGFGSLIALPFQGLAQRQGNTVFLDDTFTPYPDQWMFLSQVRKTSAAQAHSIVENAVGSVLGPLEYARTSKQSAPYEKAHAEQNDPGEKSMPWKPRKTPALSACDFPTNLAVTKADMLYISASELSPAACDRIRRLAAFGNPEFYRAQTMRQSVFGKPRIIDLSESRQGYIALPRGCEPKLVALLRSAGVSFEIRDERYSGKPIDVTFKGELRPNQLEAANALLKHENGILSAPTGFGKTVIGSYLIAALKMRTLVIVPKTTLLTQWHDCIAKFLNINEIPEPLLTPTGRSSKRKRPLVGQIGGGKNAPSGIIDISTFQSLFEKGEAEGERQVKELVRNYGFVLCDECQHGAAPQLERILKAIIARNVYGLSATPQRSDGLDAITFLLCGPIRHKVDPKEQAQQQNFVRRLLPRFTNMRFPNIETNSTFNQIIDALCSHKERNRLIVRDVAQALGKGRTPLVVTKRKSHAKALANAIDAAGHDARLLIGEGTPSQRRALIQAVKEAADQEPLAIIATESYLGEGFDMPRLDALFLATPIAWDGNVTQQSGRLHREHEGKADVVVYDYRSHARPNVQEAPEDLR